MARNLTAPPRCLVLEDEVLIGMNLEESLCAAGFDVRWVTSIRSALEVLSSVAFDAVILDLVIRSRLCTQLARELKERCIPFLVYSGHSHDRSLVEFRDVPWLEKPAEPEALIRALAEIADVSEAHRGDAAAIGPRSGQAKAR